MKRNPYFKTVLQLALFLNLNSIAFAQVGSYFTGSGSGTGNTGNYCTGAGINALHSSNSGANNAAFGTNALYWNTSGYDNTAIGIGALTGNTTGFYNVAVGTSALSVSSSGSRNTAIGYFSLTANTVGTNNTAVGNNSLKTNTTGTNNTGIGNSSLSNNTTGYENTALGSASLANNTTGYYNTGIGTYALALNTTGYNNTSTGQRSMNFNRVGYENCAYGHFALHLNDSAEHNNAFGAYALYNNKGNQNCAYGTYLLDNNLKGSDNSAFGYNTMSLSTTGSSNVAFGKDAGTLRTIYNKCTFLGATADASANNFTNAMAIGFGAKVDGSYKVRVGNSSVTSIGGQVGWTTVSDLRLKENIKDSKLGLDFILNLHPVTYNYKDEEQLGILYTGLIAQEVDAAAKKEGVEFSGVDKNGEYWGIRYGDLSVPLIRSVQELDEKTAEENQNLKTEIAQLKNTILQMQQCLETLCNESRTKETSNPKLQTSNFLQVSPNPTTGKITITFQLEKTTSDAVIKITDARGVEIKSVSIGNIQSGNIESDMSNYANGTYHLQIISNGISLQAQSFIISK